MEKGLKTLHNVSRTVTRREQRRDSHDPADHDDAQHDATAVGSRYHRGPSSLMSHPEDNNPLEGDTLIGDTLIEEPIHPHVSQPSYKTKRDELSYSRVVGVEEQRLRSYSINAEDRPGRYPNSGPIPHHSYSPPRSYSTSSSATIFSPVSATAPPPHQQTLPGISSLDGMDGILHARPQMPPILRQPVTTH